MTLEHLDTLIAFAVIMLGVSLFITVLTQGAIAFLGLRGRDLRWGLERVLREVDPDLKQKTREIANKVLTHPILSDSILSRWAGDSKAARITAGWRLAKAIKAEELERALATLAASKVIPEAEKVTKLVNEKKEELLAWFGAMMDRTTQRFTTNARIWTAAFAFLVAFGLQLDSFELLSRLSNDAMLRQGLLASVDALTEIKKQVDAATHKENQQSSEQSKKSLEEAVRLSGSIKTTFEKAQLKLIPDPYFPVNYWPFGKADKRQLLGILASGVLLSLGAPFWFNSLKAMASFKPLLARKWEEEQKKQTP